MSSPVPPEGHGAISDIPLPHRPPVWRRSLKNFLIIALTTVVLLEIILRALGIANPVLYERDENTGYRIKPNQHVRYLGNTIAINAFGVRDPRPFDKHDPHKRRVLVLGDSVTWGGVLLGQEELFTSIAESELENVEVINAGINGYSVNQMVALFRTHLQELEPDHVIVSVIPRDFERPPVTRLTGEGVAFPQKQPMLALLFAINNCRQILQDRSGWAWLRAPAAAIRDAPGMDAIEDNVAAIKMLSEMLHGNSRLSVVFMPSQFTPAELELVRAIRGRLVGMKIEVMDLTRTMVVNDDFIDRVHYSAKGHRKVGKALALVI